MALFFGCRHQGVDELYGDEFRAATVPGQPLSGPAGGYFVAYSRDGGGSGGEKRYVTHLLREQGALVWQMLSGGGHVYVAGAAGAMPRDVLDALVQVVLHHAPGMGSAAHAEAWVRQLELQGRCHMEVWA
jgi:sulfite reductase alpha subunit-like flavoprotein